MSQVAGQVHTRLVGTGNGVRVGMLVGGCGVFC